MVELINIRQGETDKIPYSDRVVTFICVSQTMIRVDKTWAGKLEILDNIKKDDLLLGAWTGKYSTDIFLLDVKWLKQTEEYKYHRKR